MNPIFDFEKFIEKVSAALSEKFPSFDVKEFGTVKEINKKTLFVDVEEFDCDEDYEVGTGQVRTLLRLHVYVVRSMDDGNKLRVKKNALDVLEFGLNNRWNYNACGAAKPLGAFPDFWRNGGRDKGAEEFHCMRCEFEHAILIGQNRLEETYENGSSPDDVYAIEQGGNAKKIAGD